MSPREDYLRQFLPPLNPNVVVGSCAHACAVRVTMGSKKPEEIGMRYRFVSVIALVGVIFYFCSPLVPSPQCPFCRVKFKDDLKPHDPETRNRLWNRLMDWDKGGRQGLPKVEVEVGRNRPLAKVDRDLSESHVKAEVRRPFRPSQTSPH